MTDPAFKPGMVCYGKMLLSIMRGPRSGRDLHIAYGIRESCAMAFMMRLRERRLAHVAMWLVTRADRRGTPKAFFAFGGIRDVPRPLAADGKQRGTNLKLDRRLPYAPLQVAFILAIQALQEGATRKQIHEQTGLTRKTVGILIDTLTDGDACYISGWQRSGHQVVSVYSLCTPHEPHVDAPKPATQRNPGSPTTARVKQLDTNMVRVA